MSIDPRPPTPRTHHLLLAAALAIALPSLAAPPDRELPPLRLRAPAPVLSEITKAEDDALVRVVVVEPGRLPAIRAELAARGVTTLGHLPESALLVVAEPPALADLDGLLAVAPWTPTQALLPELAAMTPQQVRSFPAGVPLLIELVSEPGAGETTDRLTAAGARISWIDDAQPVSRIGLLVPADSFPEVRAVLQASRHLVRADLQPPLRLRNNYTAWLCQTGRPGYTDLFVRGLRGEGQIIGLMDTGIDIDSCYFYDPHHGLPAQNDGTGTEVDLSQRKVLAVDFYASADWPQPGVLSWDSGGHGSHVAGTAAGHAIEDVWYGTQDGMAPRARLVVQDGGFLRDDCADLPGLGCPVRPLEPVLQQAYDQGARIHTNSWGDEENIQPYNRYTERTADIDRFCWNHKDFLVLFACGNAGTGWDTVGSPATGKNVVAVGATVHGSISPICVASFSSRGWTEDGRIKPDLVVPGRNIWSAESDGHIETFSCRMTAKSGTSMAAPAVAGLAALVRQYYEEGYYPEGRRGSGEALTPSAALIKATLIASAVDLSTTGCAEVEPIPSRDQGWGMVQLDRALVFPNSNFSLLVDDNRQGFCTCDLRSVVRMHEQADQGPLKVVLVWTDPPSSSLAAVNLVNDLDLVVSGPDGVFLGNVFAGGVSVSGGEADRLNNVEVVWLPEAQAGNWRITVTPETLSEAPQDYALVVTSHRSAPPPRRSGRRPQPE